MKMRIKSSEKKYDKMRTNVFATNNYMQKNKLKS